MRKWLNNPWIVGALALAAVAFCAVSLRDQFPSFGSRSAAPVAAEDPSAAATADATDNPPTIAQGVAIGDVREVFPVGRVDPADAPAQPTAPLERSETVLLSAVWSQGNTSVAIVNGRTCTAGDEVGSVVIESISSEGVWVHHSKGRKFLSVGQPISVTLPPKPGPAANALATQS